jgi:GH18 family chitinase
VVGYFPWWYNGSLDAIPWDKFTHIVYAFADPTSTGGVELYGDSLKLKGVVQRAHAVGVPVLISFGGWTGSVDSDFEPMAASSTYRAAFVGNAVAFMSHYGLDGIDIDWEFPNNSTERTNFSSLMSELRAALPSGKLLTAAVAATSYYGQWIANDVFDEVDFLFLMAYAGSTVPHSPFSHAVESLDYWRDIRLLPQGKTVLGVPFYGKNPSGVNKSYRELVRLDAQAPSKDSVNGYHYNGRATIGSKTVLSLQRGSGIGIWEISQDSVGTGISLLDAIHDAMSGTVPPYDYTKVVYDNALNGWADWSWNVTVSPTNSSPAYGGSGSSIAATYTAAWGGVQLAYSSGMGTANLSKLEFYVHGGTAGGQNLRVYLSDMSGTSLTKVALNSYVDGGSVAAGAWRKVSIPLSAMGSNGNPITRVVVQDGSGGTQPTFYLDDIRFVP